MDVLVIGAGVIGLTTGICLAEAGLSVTIRTAVPPEQTTSVAAGAVWGLVRVGPPGRAAGWGRAGLEAMSKLAAEPGTGHTGPGLIANAAQYAARGGLGKHGNSQGKHQANDA